jgi:hypothetical protein
LKWISSTIESLETNLDIYCYNTLKNEVELVEMAEVEKPGREYLGRKFRSF